MTCTECHRTGGQHLAGCQVGANARFFARHGFNDASCWAVYGCEECGNLHLPHLDLSPVAPGRRIKDASECTRWPALRLVWVDGGFQHVIKEAQNA